MDVNSAGPRYPYDTWPTAATNIQDAVDVAKAGDQILVTNGVYQAGGRPSIDGSTNRVSVAKPVMVMSVNGSVATAIDGGGRMRCAYLADGATLTGFALTNGTAGSGGGAYCESTNALISGCTLINNTARIGGGSYSGTLADCTLIGNTCPMTSGMGGGASGAFLRNCTLSGNATGGPLTGGTVGGAAYQCELVDCTISRNSANGAGASGGGACDCTLNDCTLTENHADYGGGGAAYSALTNCTISSNRSDYSGGGLTGCNLNNCVVSENGSGYGGGGNGCLLIGCNITGNYASYGGGVYGGCLLYNCRVTANTGLGDGGGAYYCTLNNCTVYGNAAPYGGQGWGAYGGTLNNSIVYYNTGGVGGADCAGSTLNFCCVPTATGPGCITNAPLFVGDLYLQAGSPCINSGNNIYVGTSFDLGGNLRVAAGIVDMGAYEFQTAGPLTVLLQASLTNVPIGYPVTLTGIFSKGQADSWNFGDGTIVSNQLSVTHSWDAAGDYDVRLTAYDVSVPAGVSASLTVHVKTQIVYYVSANGKNPMPPYDSWSTAATNIQEAVDDALPVPRSLVLVTNGVYQCGGRPAYGSLTNRVVIGKPVTVRSVNGPAVTTIQGQPGIGDAAVRCAYLSSNCVLAGFTLTAGATHATGSAASDTSGGAVWCESTTAVVSNCVLVGNAAVAEGGGIYGGTINNSSICSNRVAFSPGSGNGGGASSAILNDCALFQNVVGGAGAGAHNSNLRGCSLTSNQAVESGGGANASTLSNCTLTANSAANGGGSASCTLNNCINYYNWAPNGPNYWGGSMNYCCTLPLPGSGEGNTSAEPMLTDSAHISASSPCRGTGDTNYLAGMDIDCEAWLSPPSIGCDEFYGVAATGGLSLTAQLSYTNVATGFAVDCAGVVLGHAAASVWSFGDGTRETNRISVSHTWAVDGVYQVVFTAYNSTNPSGVSTTNMVHVLNRPVHYVSGRSGSPSAPYLSWATAAVRIQDAVDAAYGGGTVLVTNGIYQTGGKVVYGSLSNRVVIGKAITVQSVNGPTVTFVKGYQLPGATNGAGAMRCVYMTNNSVLAGFTLSSGATLSAGDVVREQSGGGIFCESMDTVISNCVLAANAAADSAGGAYQGTFYNCFFSGNWALDSDWNGFDEKGGGGALKATLNNCVLSNNWVAANTGGGASFCTLSNCTLVGNSAYYGGGGYYCVLKYSLLSGNSAPGAGGGVAGGALIGCVLQYNSSWMGGAAEAASLENCLLVTNSAGYLGGGADSCQLSGCTVVGNSAETGGGVNASTLNNCIVYYNSASDGANYANSGLRFCCTTPSPELSSSITNIPGFVDSARGDFRLAGNSACINSGNNTYVSTLTDLQDNPRIKGGSVDIGAYEYQTPTSTISYAWLLEYGLPNDGTADHADSDGDGFDNWSEWWAGTNPRDPASLLRITSITRDTSGVIVAWQSASNITYSLERCTNLSGQLSFLTVASNIFGQAGMESYTDETATNRSPYFYRVGVGANP